MELGQLGINDTQKVSNSDPQRPHKGQGKQDFPWMPGCLMGSQHLPPKSIALCVSLCACLHAYVKSFMHRHACVCVCV